jgi:hypothetical protein
MTQLTKPRPCRCPNHECTNEGSEGVSVPDGKGGTNQYDVCSTCAVELREQEEKNGR